MKYFVKQINPEYQNCIIFDDTMASEKNFQEAYYGLIFNPQVQHTNAHGPVYNSDYYTMGNELYNHIMDNLELALYDWAELDTDEQTPEALTDTLRYYDFSNPLPGNGSKGAQLDRWLAIFNGRNCADDDVVVMEALELLTGHKWESYCLKGCSQSEWVYVLYDTTLWTDDDLENFRVSYWNLGSEWEFHWNYNDLAAHTQNRPVDPEDIEGYFAYCPIECPTDEELKAWAVDVIDLPDCKPEDVTLFKFKGQRRVDEYTEV